MSRNRLRRPPGGLALALAVAVGAAGSAGVLVAAQDRADEVERVADMGDALADNSGPAENYLLVGSDSREGIDESTDNADQTGTESDVTGRRSDTIMILRRDEEGGASLLSVPRDLWVEIAGTGGDEGKINSAYNEGPERLARTITQALGIPIHHYVEVDFVGFTRMVDEIGGVEICFDNPARDTHSGLNVENGCQRLDGAQALAYTRSRYYEEFIDGEWTQVGNADLGRIERQQQFIRQAVTEVLLEVEGNPFALNDLIDAATASVRIDADADPVRAANALRAAADTGLQTFTPPVEFIEVDGQSALELAPNADALLDYFRGIGPLPPPSTTVVSDGTDATTGGDGDADDDADGGAGD
jgi:LCP family protein required for cell wall assembly